MEALVSQPLIRNPKREYVYLGQVGESYWREHQEEVSSPDVLAGLAISSGGFN